jgi:hypothetical protein
VGHNLNPVNWILPSIAWGTAKALGDDDVALRATHDFQENVQRAGKVADATGLDTVAEKVGPPLHWLYNNIWNRPASTLAQMNTNVQNHSQGIGSYVDGGEWKTAWDNSNWYSSGQAITDHAAALKRSLGQGLTADPDALDAQYKREYEESKGEQRKAYYIVNQYGFEEEVAENDPRLQDPKNGPHSRNASDGLSGGLAGNPYATLEERKAFYQTTWSGRMTSGSIDFVSNIAADPLNKILPGIGQVGKLNRGVLTNADELGKAQAALETGERVRASNFDQGSLSERAESAFRVNRFRENTLKLYDQVDKAGTAAEVMKLPMFFNTADKGALAFAFARTNAIADPTEKLMTRNNIMGAITGDATALQKLATEHADLSAELRRLGEAPEAMKAPEPRFTSANAAERSAYWMEQGRIAEVNAKKDAIEYQLDSANALFRNAGAYTDRGVLPAIVQRGVTELRNGRTILKDSATGRTVHVVNAFDTVRPSYINLTNVGEGATQLRNNLNRIPNVSREQVEIWTNGFLNAPTRAARQSVVHQATEEMFSAAGRQFGISTEKVEEIMKVAGQVSADVRKQLDTGRRLYSAADGRTATVIDHNGEAIAYDKPLLNTMLEDSTHIPDADLINATVKALKDVDLSKGAGDAYQARVMAKKALDEVTGAWSSAMLLRPAYGLRVAADDQARTLALLGGHVYTQTALEGIKNFVGNWRRYAYKDLQAAGAQRAGIDYRIQRLEAEIKGLRNGGPTWQQTGPKVSREEFEKNPEVLYHSSTKLPTELDNTRGIYTSDTEVSAQRWGSQAANGWARPSGATKDAFTQLREAARGKRQIQRRLSGGNWVNTPFSSVSASDIENGLIRFRPKSVKPSSTSMTVYGQPLDLRSYDQIPADLKTAMGWQNRDEWRAWIQNKVHRQDQDILLDYMEFNGYGRAYLDRRLNGSKDEILVNPTYANYGGKDAYASQHVSKKGARIVNRPDAKRTAEIRDRRRQIAKLEQDKGEVEAALLRTRNGKLARRRDTADKQYIGMAPQFHNGHQINPYMNRSEAEASFDQMLTQGRPSDAYGITLSEEMLKDLRASGDYGVVNGAMANWSQSMAAAINQFRKDPVARRMMDGGTVADIQKFMAENINARNEWANFAKDPRFNGDQVGWLQAGQQTLDQVFPGNAMGTELFALARGRDVTPADLERIFPDAATRPDVHGPLMNPYVPHLGQKFMDTQRNVMTKYFETVADKPSLYGARNRIFTEVYQDELTKMVDRFGGTADKKVPYEIFQQFSKNADELAKKAVRDTLYDNSGKINLIDKMRYISPFAGATQDVLVKWSRLFYDDPTRLYNYLKAGPAFDRQQGNLTAMDDKGNGYFMVPKALQPFLGKGVAGNDWVIPKGNFNLIFQGQGYGQFSPGFGPMVAMPVNSLVMHFFPEFGDSKAVSAVLPYGIKNEDIGGAVLPNWWRYTFAAMGIGSADEVNNVSAMLRANEQVRYERGERKTSPINNPEFEAELKNRTRNYFLTRAWDSATSPVSKRPQDQYSFYQQTYREYQKAYEGKTEVGPDGETKPVDTRMKFLNDYPEFGAKTITLSENTTGINAYAEVMDNTRKFAKEIKANPEFGYSLIGAENLGGTFDSGVYQSQLASGSRRTLDPDDAQKRFDEQMGWVEYTKARMAVNMELERRGITSLDDKRASKLKTRLGEYVDGELREKYPMFYEDFNTRSSAGANTFLNFATKTLIPTVGHDRMDIQLLEEYLGSRRIIQAELANRKSKTLTAKSNSKLAARWDEYVQGLIAQDPGFEQMYSRDLQFDNMKGDY